MKELLKDYKKRKKEIIHRLRYFKRVFKRGDREIFGELCFCILTPQARATVCDEAISKLKRNNLLFNGSQEDIRSYLKGVRFPDNKSKYVISARKFFRNSRGLNVKSKLDIKDLFKTRDWLVKNIKGLGYKEASHFLRNIGLGQGLAILDRHILKNLKKYGVIKKIPASLSRRDYIKIEDKMRKFFKKVNIPIEEIDLLFWSKETGIIFK